MNGEGAQNIIKQNGHAAPNYKNAVDQRTITHTNAQTGQASAAHPIHNSVPFVPIHQPAYHPKNITTPLFERLGSEEGATSQDLKAYSRVIHTQNRRLTDLERVQDELERRLEIQTKENKRLEAEMDDLHRQWSQRFTELENDRDYWMKEVALEKKRNEQLLKQINHKEKEIHRMIQHKYDVTSNHHGVHAASSRRGEGTIRQISPSIPKHIGATKNNNFFESPHELLSKTESPGTQRERQAKNALLHFFGMGR